MANVVSSFFPQKFPDNFARLHAGEEFLREKSIEAVAGKQALAAHAHMIEGGMDTLDYFSRNYQTTDVDLQTVQNLGARLFNGAAAALKLMLSGYYQKAALTERDMLETVFLLDFFTIDRAKIAEWRTSDQQTRWNKFKPGQIRIALDKRDGFAEGKRKADYDRFSALAGHPTPEGFQMLRPRGMDAHVGPFFDETALEAVLSELAKLAVIAGEKFEMFFSIRAVEDAVTKIAGTEGRAHWAEVFFGRPFDPECSAELRRIKDELSRT